jgi:hypothetical protein
MCENIDPIIKFYRPELFKEWLEKCWNLHGCHGSELVELLGKPRDGKPGCPDNVANAAKLLSLAEKAGWIKRHEVATPTVEQKFFGVGGLRGNHKHPQYRSTVEYWWEPNRDCQYLMEFLDIEVRCC